MIYQVNEIFDSVQGEGYWIGVPATFIRLQGCSVGCTWCDTKYTWAKGGQKMTVDMIEKEIGFDHVVITGGEPTLYNLDALLRRLEEMECYTQLETSGQNPYKGKLVADWTTWSPKPKLFYGIESSLAAYVSEVKFVVDGGLEPADVDLALSLVSPVCYVTFMPEGCPPSQTLMYRAANLVELYADRHRVRFSDRLQYRLGVK